MDLLVDTQAAGVGTYAQVGAKLVICKPSLQVDSSYKNNGVRPLAELKDGRLHQSRAVRSDTLCPMGARKFWYSWGTMSALNGDKARFNRERRAKLARRERSQAIRRKLKDPTPPREAGTQL